MKIRTKEMIDLPSHCFQADHVYDLPPELAEELLTSGKAEKVVERTVSEEPETTDRTQPRGKTGRGNTPGKPAGDDR